MSRRTRALRDEIADINWQLNDESERALKTMDNYLGLKNIGALQRLSVLRDLTQMALDAQMQGRSLDEVFGSDHQAFCDCVIAELPQPTARERRLRILRDGVGGLALFWFIAFPMMLLMQYLSYASLPGLWETLVEYGYISTDLPVTLGQLLIVAIGGGMMACLSVSNRSIHANRQFHPRRQAAYYVLFFGALAILNWLSRQGVIPVPEFLFNELVTMPLSVNLIIQALLIGTFVTLNEQVDL